MAGNLGPHYQHRQLLAMPGAGDGERVGVHAAHHQRPSPVSSSPTAHPSSHYAVPQSRAHVQIPPPPPTPQYPHHVLSSSGSTSNAIPHYQIRYSKPGSVDHRDSISGNGTTPTVPISPHSFTNYAVIAPSSSPYPAAPASMHATIPVGAVTVGGLPGASQMHTTNGFQGGISLAYSSAGGAQVHSHHDHRASSYRGGYSSVADQHPPNSTAEGPKASPAAAHSSSASAAATPPVPAIGYFGGVPPTAHVTPHHVMPASSSSPTEALNRRGAPEPHTSIGSAMSPTYYNNSPHTRGLTAPPSVGLEPASVVIPMGNGYGTPHRAPEAVYSVSGSTPANTLYMGKDAYGATTNHHPPSGPTGFSSLSPALGVGGIGVTEAGDAYEVHDPQLKTPVKVQPCNIVVTAGSRQMLTTPPYVAPLGQRISFRICEAFQAGHCPMQEECMYIHVNCEYLSAVRQTMISWLDMKQKEFETTVAYMPHTTFRIFFADLKEIVEVPVTAMHFTRGLYIDPQTRGRRTRNSSPVTTNSTHGPIACGLFATDPTHCKWGRWCNQVHIQPSWIQSRKIHFESWSSSLESNFQRMAPEQMFAIHDPHLKSGIHVPKVAIAEFTRGLFQGSSTRAPSVCILFQRRRCTAQACCNQVHVIPRYLELLREYKIETSRLTSVEANNLLTELKVLQEKLTYGDQGMYLSRPQQHRAAPQAVGARGTGLPPQDLHHVPPIPVAPNWPVAVSSSGVVTSGGGDIGAAQGTGLLHGASQHHDPRVATAAQGAVPAPPLSLAAPCPPQESHWKPRNGTFPYEHVPSLSHHCLTSPLSIPSDCVTTDPPPQSYIADRPAAAVGYAGDGALSGGPTTPGAPEDEETEVLELYSKSMPIAHMKKVVHLSPRRATGTHSRSGANHTPRGTTPQNCAHGDSNGSSGKNLDGSPSISFGLAFCEQSDSEGPSRMNASCNECQGSSTTSMGAARVSTHSPRVLGTSSSGISSQRTGGDTGKPKQQRTSRGTPQALHASATYAHQPYHPNGSTSSRHQYEEDTPSMGSSGTTYRQHNPYALNHSSTSAHSVHVTLPQFVNVDQTKGSSQTTVEVSSGGKSAAMNTTSTSGGNKPHGTSTASTAASLMTGGGHDRGPLSLAYRPISSPCNESLRFSPTQLIGLNASGSVAGHMIGFEGLEDMQRSTATNTGPGNTSVTSLSSPKGFVPVKSKGASGSGP